MQTSPESSGPQIAIIIPACDEAPAIGRVLAELLRAVDAARFAVAVGVNGSSDNTGAIAREYPVLVAETKLRGYGHGCVAAINSAERAFPSLRAFIFYAADGASDPRDLLPLVDAFRDGSHFVLGARTGLSTNWPIMSFSHVVANFALACWCGLLAGRAFTDLAPLRLIDRELFHAIAPRELTFGWTIEAQIVAAKLGARITELSAHERPRLAGEQKVSGVSWQRTVAIGCRIVAAGFRSWRRCERAVPMSAETSIKQLLPHPQRGS